MVGLAVVGIGLGFLWMGTKGNHLELNGTILKVRTMPLSPVASLVVVDFRVTDPSDIPFVIKSASLTLEPATGATLDGMVVSKPDIENVFKYNPILGPKFNDVLGIKDRIEPINAWIAWWARDSKSPSRRPKTVRRFICTSKRWTG